MALKTEEYSESRMKLSPKNIAESKEPARLYAEGPVVYSQVLPARESTVNYCAWAENAITVYGVEKALERWGVICEVFETEDWWPSVVRQVKPLFIEASRRRNRQKEMAEQKQSQAVVVQTGDNPTAVEKAEQAIGQNMGKVNYMKYE